MTQSIQTRGSKAKAPDSLEIMPVAGRIGAEIRGVKLGGDLAEETIAAITAALVRHKVIFFRGQNHLDDAGHEAFAARMGEPLAHPTVSPTPGSNFLFPLDSKEGVPANVWHTDLTFLPAFPAASILRGLIIPPFGGDTLWANTVAAYEDLPPPLKAMAEALTAVHTNATDYATRYPNTAAATVDHVKATFQSTTYEAEHPVVHVHPVSGERALLLGAFVKRLVGLSREDSDGIFRLLQDHVSRPENTVRWRWTVGDVAIWDNRSTQHRAIADYGDQHRRLRRATIAGKTTVGIDGRRSRAVAG